MKSLCVNYRFLLGIFIIILSKYSDTKIYNIEFGSLQTVEYDKSYLPDWDMYVRRSGRGAPYVLNSSFTLMHPVGNNFTIHVTSYEKSNLQYKKMPLEIMFGVCDFLTRDLIIAPFLNRFTTPAYTCPLMGHYDIKNMVVKSMQHPMPVWQMPDTLRVDFHIYRTSTKKTLVKFLAHMKMKERISPKH